MGEREMWATIIKAQALGVQRLYAAGALSAKEAVEECDRLLAHERGCPPDAEVILRDVRKQASAKLQ